MIVERSRAARPALDGGRPVPGAEASSPAVPAALPVTRRGAAISFRSRPTQKCRPRAATTTHRVSSSSAITATARGRSAQKSRPIALRASGRFSQSVVTFSSLAISSTVEENTARRYQDASPLHCPTSPAPLLPRSEEHTSELQSQFHLVCRLLL